MKKTAIIISIIIILIAISYILIVTSVRTNYSRIYNECLGQLDLIKNAISNDENNYNYPYELEASQCISSGGCWEDCGSGCGFPEKPSWNPVKSIQQYLKNKRSTICLAVCRQGCLYPI